MSGDVQPRKRKDKRRKRDDDEGLPISSGRSGSADQSEHVAIHIHKESSTGGHWCAKIIFFALLVALAGIVGLIIVEHRGSTDVDTPVSASQWAMIFDGWVDDTKATHEEEETDSHHLAGESHEHEDHDDGDHEQDEEVDEHEKEGDEDEASHDEELDGDNKQEGEEEEEEEEEGPEREDEDLGEEREEEGEQEEEEEGEEENQGPGGIDGIDDYNEDTDADADNDIDDGYFKPHDQSDDEIEPQQDRTISEEDVDENQSKEEENDDYDVERPFDYASTEKVNNYRAVFDDDFGALDEIEDDPDEDENDINDPYDVDLDLSIEGIVSTKNVKDLGNVDEDADLVNIPGVNDIDDHSAEPLEEIGEDEPEEIINEDIQEEKEEEKEAEIEQELEEESASVSMKFGVGVALIVTAHFVLVRRWNNGEADNPEILSGSNEVPDLTRRNTIVAPSRISEVVCAPEDEHELLDEEQEKTYKELQSTYKKVGSTDKKRSGIEEIFAKKTADLELILRGATKANNNDPKERAHEDTDSGEDEDDDNYEDEEIEDDDVNEDVDDVELIEKLDKKYGKLPASAYEGNEHEDNEGNETEDEEEDEIEEDELEEDYEDEDEEEEEEEDDYEEEEEEEEDCPERYNDGASEKHTGSSVKQATNQQRIWTNPSKSKSKGEQSYGLVGDPYDDHVEESITRF